MSGNNIVKYIFAVVVVILIAVTMVIIVNNRSQTDDYDLDQTSTLNNIQTDLRLAIAEYDTINPLKTNNKDIQEISKIIYEPLVTLNENYKLEYSLAESIELENDVTYVIHLRKGVLFSDGTPFTANDVKFTIVAIKYNYSPIYSSNLSKVTNIEVVDEYTLKLTISEPTQFFEYNLTFPIMCEKYYDGEDFFSSEKTPIGTGMFKISEISSNIIKLQKNDTYWNSEKNPMVTDININLYSNVGEVYNAFKNGEIDILTEDSTGIESYIGTMGYNKVEYKARNYDFLVLNTQDNVLSDVYVRRALSKIIDRDNIIANCLGSGYVSSNFSLDMGCWLYTKDVSVQANTDEAKQILAEGGWSKSSNTWVRKIDGETTRLEIIITVDASNSLRVSVAENIVNQLVNFGIDASVRYLSNDNYTKAIDSKNYQVLLVGVQNGFSPSLTRFFANDNMANYYNQEMSDLMNTISNNTFNENELYNAYSRVYDIYLEDVPYIGLYRNTNIVVYNQSLVGNIKANSFNIYHNIELWYRQ